jgi:hypothetical protein
VILHVKPHLSKIIFWTAFQEKGKVRFLVCHSGLDPESSDSGSYKIWQRHWIPAFAGMTTVGVFWTAYGNLTFRTKNNLSKNVRFQQVISPKGGFSDYFGQ